MPFEGNNLAYVFIMILVLCLIQNLHCYTKAVIMTVPDVRVINTPMRHKFVIITVLEM